MTLEPKASLESDWIDTCAEEISRIKLPRMTCKSNIKKLIQKHLPKEDTYQRGYNQGFEDGANAACNDIANRGGF